MSRVGQFGVVRTKGLAGWAIRLGTRSQVNHAFIYVGGGEIVEAQPGGARVSKASKYPDAIWSHFDLGQWPRIKVAARALAFTHANDGKGVPYNFLDIVVLTLLSLGIRWGWLQKRAQSSRTLICSQLVDRAYAEAGIHLYDDGRPDGLVTPGDLLMLLAERSKETAL